MSQRYRQLRLDERPAEIANRENVSHWEVDLVQFRKIHRKANLASLVDRSSRYRL